MSDAGLGGAGVSAGIWNYVQVDPLQNVLLEETDARTQFIVLYIKKKKPTSGRIEEL